MYHGKGYYPTSYARKDPVVLCCQPSQKLQRVRCRQLGDDSLMRITLPQDLNVQNLSLDSLTARSYMDPSL